MIVFIRKIRINPEAALGMGMVLLLCMVLLLINGEELIEEHDKETIMIQDNNNKKMELIDLEIAYNMGMVKERTYRRKRQEFENVLGKELCKRLTEK